MSNYTTYAQQIFCRFFKLIQKSINVRHLNTLILSVRLVVVSGKDKSTKYALINVTDMINNSINAENKSTGLFINFIKAFELLVTHEVLLMAMEAAGVRGSRSVCVWGIVSAQRSRSRWVYLRAPSSLLPVFYFYDRLIITEV